MDCNHAHNNSSGLSQSMEDLSIGTFYYCFARITLLSVITPNISRGSDSIIQYRGLSHIKNATAINQL